VSLPDGSLGPHAVAAASSDPETRRRIRRRALALTAVALAFYLGFIALSIYRSRHG